MERSHPSSGRSATPADISRNGRPTSIGTGGRHQSECPADIIGIRRLATVPPDTPFDRLVDLAKLRWRIERDYQELKQELGLGHYEGRGWRGFHHHATLCIAAYAFLIAERARVPPSAAGEVTDQF